MGDFEVGFYLELRNQETLPPVRTLLGTETIDAGDDEDESGQLTLPADAVAGQYNLLVVADYNNAVEEPDETNNQLGSGILTITGAVSSESDADGAAFSLSASPNPSSGTFSLSYELASPSAVRLAVYDELGREVAVVVDERRSAGAHAVSLDASAWAPGVYLVRLAAAGAQATRTLTVAR